MEDNAVLSNATQAVLSQHYEDIEESELPLLPSTSMSGARRLGYLGSAMDCPALSYGLPSREGP